MSTNIEILDYDRLRGILPHRYPCLMIDRAMVNRADKKAVSIKNATMNETFFQGHFPDNPVMPGMLILEAMIQTGGVIMLEAMNVQVDFAFLKSVKKTKFRKPVFPGDRLEISAELIRFRNGIARLRSTARVLDQLACQAEFSLGIRENIPEILHPTEFAPPLQVDGQPLDSKPVADIHNVVNILPHRYPFILVDSILRLKDQRIFGLKNVTGNEPFFLGHFPKHAVMQGTMLIEAMAQVGAVYILGRPQNRGKLGYLMAIDHARFRRPARPGDQLVIEVETLLSRDRGGKARGRVHVGNNVVAETLITFVIVNRTVAAKTRG